jgi:acid phosphatase type 7
MPFFLNKIPVFVMKNYFKKIVCIFIICNSIIINNLYANDTLVYFAKSSILPGSSWKYLDNNTSLDGIAWKDSSFNDMSWNTGNSKFGYANGDENTIVNDGCIPQGSNCTNKNITTYFRKTFLISNPSAYNNFLLQYKRDDGIEIFINGVRFEINNLTDPVTSSTLASSASDDGQNIYSVNIPSTAFFGNGKRNVIAVDIHQTSAASSDIAFDLQLIGMQTPTLTRGPYLQMGKQDGVSIRWRTSTATNSIVKWGVNFGSYSSSITVAELTTEHEIRLSNLIPDTKYYYSVESSGIIYQNQISNYFVTLPAAVPNRKMRFIALGDCGNGSTNQIKVKDTYLNFIGNNNTDAMLLLGDNAYSDGLDNEYQTKFFDIYKDDLLRNIKLYPAPGNHDYANYGSLQGSRTTPYYNSFTMPTAGEIGGVASGTEAYYSYNIGNVHFISLDSYGQENANTTRLYDTLGAQVVWLKNDLAANNKMWTVVYFHHPPYTKTSHNSDAETELIRMRENFIRILERNGVDLVLSGHSHGYERSYLLKNFYNNATAPLQDADFNASLHTATGNLQNALYDGSSQSCAYIYNEGKFNHGTVYAVAGSAGQVGGASTGYPHDAMYYSNNTNGGLFYFEVDNNRLDGKFVSYSGTSTTPIIKDQFTIFKGVNKVNNVNATLNVPLTLKASWTSGNFYWPSNNGSGNSITVPTNIVGTYNYIVKDIFANTCLKDSFHVVVSLPLPLTLIDFTANYSNKKVNLQWSTSQEINTKEFLLEQSIDGINFNFLTTVKAAGNSSQVINYKSFDNNPAFGENYYRLTEIDTDGKKIRLGIKKVEVDVKNNFSFNTYQLTNGEVQIDVFDNIIKTYSLYIFDAAGKTIVQKKIGKNSSVVLSSGFYFAKLINEEGKIITKKIQVQ